MLEDLPLQRRSSQPRPPTSDAGRGRLLVLMALITLVFLALSGRIYYLQTQRQSEFERDARRRRELTTYQVATRGLIYDRDGRPLVQNAPTYQVVIRPIRQIAYSDNVAALNPLTNQPITDTQTGEPVESQARILQRIDRVAVYNRLAQLINRPDVTAGEIYTKVVQAVNAGRTFQAVVVAENIPRETALIIQEQSLQLPGVEVQSVGSRIYPYGELFGNLLGFTGKVLDTSARDFDLVRGGEQNEFLVDQSYGGYLYDVDRDRIGQAGLEAYLERELRGQKGRRETVVDVSYEEIETLTETVPTAGNNVRLTLDLRLQTIISEELKYGLNEVNSPRGAVVVLNPNTGEVLGMLGFPTFDNNLFARGISAAEYRALTETVHSALVNHATQDNKVPPGSTFKIVTTAAILEEDSEDNVDAGTRIYDPGIFELPSVFEGQPGRKFYCWIGLPPRNSRHEFQTAEEALKNSCDTYFYKAVGGFNEENIRGIGSDALGNWAAAFGIGQAYENLGVPYNVGFPASQSRIRERAGGIWTQGDSYNAAIGQGAVEATPLEMANVAAVIANGGTLYSPQVIRDVINPQNQIVAPFEPKVIRKLPIRDSTMALIRRAMWRVVNEEGGTANYSASLQKWNFEYAGKTGTAEFCDDIAQKARLCPPDREFLPTHAWYVAYAPYDNPQIAMSVFIWNGGQGSAVAAPIAARIIARYFDLPIPREELPKIVPASSE